MRLEGRVYTPYRYTDRVAQRFAVADQAECHDVGTGPAGSVLPEDPPKVAVWSSPGYSTQEVLGVRFDKGSFAVFVEESVARSDADRIFRELSPQL